MSYFIQSLTGRYGYPRMLPNLVWKELRLIDFTNEDDQGSCTFLSSGLQHMFLPELTRKSFHSSIGEFCAGIRLCRLYLIFSCFAFNEHHLTTITEYFPPHQVSPSRYVEVTRHVVLPRWPYTCLF